MKEDTTCYLSSLWLKVETVEYKETEETLHAHFALEAKKGIHWHAVYFGMDLQCYLAFLACDWD